jgi:spermidine synthase
MRSEHERSATYRPDHLSDRPRKQELALVGVAFVLSGAASLVYQVGWQRILALHSGVGIYSIAMIVAAFLAGLGAGSHLGGVLSARMDPAKALRTFAWLELGVGVFGALSCQAYYDWLGRASWLYASPWRAGVTHFVALALPTVLMGMTLPFLAQATVTQASTAGRTVGFLYGINMLGASVGALLAPWILIRQFGICGAVAAAALGNAGAGLIAVALGIRRRAAGEPPAEGRAVDARLPAAAAAGVEPPGQRGLAFWAALYGLSGFCALSLEILWFRLLDVALKSTAFTFGTVLSLYLLGASAGCLLAAPLAPHIRRPLKAFLLCQCLLLSYAGLAVMLLVRLPDRTPVLSWFYQYWAGGTWFFLGWTESPSALMKLYFWLPLALFGPATVLMGLSFPILQRAVHDDPRTAGLKVGLLQAANTAGCMLGSLGVGLIALSFLGSMGTLRLLMACGVAFAAVGVWHYGSRSAFSVVTAALAVLAVALPGQASLWRRLHGATTERALFDEDATSVGAVLPIAGRWQVFVNGRAHSWLPFAGTHSWLGAAPVLVHPAPTDVAVVGLGSGDTAWASGCRSETRSITVYEISRPQPRLLFRLAALESLPGLRAFLGDPRLRVIIADGRKALADAPRRFDMIEADALWPEAAYSGNLYSVEFFRACARKLKPGGLMCTWAPTRRVFFSFAQAFPYMMATGDVLIGSNEPLVPDPAAWLARLGSGDVRRYLEHGASPQAGALLHDLGMLFGELRPLDRRALAPHVRDLNLDLFPRDEFRSP